jgi:TRAP-type C4-dicarboxylate transport system permease small subunit
MEVKYKKDKYESLEVVCHVAILVLALIATYHAFRIAFIVTFGLLKVLLWLISSAFTVFSVIAIVVLVLLLVRKLKNKTSAE